MKDEKLYKIEPYHPSIHKRFARDADEKRPDGRHVIAVGDNLAGQKSDFVCK